jgi:hypothetical protein
MGVTSPRLGWRRDFRLVSLFGPEDCQSAEDHALEAAVAAGIEVEKARVIGEPAEGPSPEGNRGGGGVEGALAAAFGIESFSFGPPQAPLLPVSGGHRVHG